MAEVLSIDDKLVTVNRGFNTDQVEEMVKRFSEQEHDNIYRITEDSLQGGMEHYEPEYMRNLLANFSGNESLPLSLEELLDPENILFEKPVVSYVKRISGNNSSCFYVFHGEKNVTDIDLARLIPKKDLTSSNKAGRYHKTAIKANALNPTINALKSKGYVVRDTEGRRVKEVLEKYKKLKPPESFDDTISFLDWAESKGLKEYEVDLLGLMNGIMHTTLSTHEKLDVGDEKIKGRLVLEDSFRRFSDKIYFRNEDDLKEIYLQEIEKNKEMIKRNYRFLNNLEVLEMFEY